MSALEKALDCVIFYGVFSSVFGSYAIFVHQAAICALFFLPYNEKKDLLARFPGAKFIENVKKVEPFTHALFETHPQNSKIPLMPQGTPFQKKVWEELRNIPFGAVISYEDLAKRVNHSKAVRAVAAAVAKNPIAFLIPCHRVIYKTGKTGNYHWGALRKQAMLDWEKCL